MGERMMHPNQQNKTTLRRAVWAFSLVELITVMAIIVIMVGLIGPSIRSMTSTAGRKGAVNILMNTLEQARATALESGVNVYVVLLRREFPNPDVIRVLRDPLPWKTNSKAGTLLETGLVPLTKWIKMPEGILLSKPTRGDNVFTATVPGRFATLLSDYENNASLGPMGPSNPSTGDRIKLSEVAAGKLGVIWYSPSGAVRQPEGNKARIVITEGVRDSGNIEAHISDRKQAQAGPGGGFEVVTIARFTGRPQLDVSTLDD